MTEAKVTRILTKSTNAVGVEADQKHYSIALDFPPGP